MIGMKGGYVHDKIFQIMEDDFREIKKRVEKIEYLLDLMRRIGINPELLALLELEAEKIASTAYILAGTAKALGAIIQEKRVIKPVSV